MHLQPHPFSIPFLIAAFVSAGFAAAVWKRRAASGAMALFIHMLGLVIWSGSFAAMWLSTSLPAQRFWLDFSALGVILVPATFLVFSLQVSHNEHLVNRRLIGFLSIEPLVGLSLLWTNDYHHLVYSAPVLWLQHGLAELQWQPGIWYRVDWGYMLLVILAGIWFLARSLSQNGELHHSQISIILLGVCFPVIADVIYISPISGYFQNLDISPLFFTFSGGLYFYAVTRRKLLDLIPVAHSILIESMTDGVVVLDLMDRIVEMNPSAGQILRVTPTEAVGRRAREILSEWEETTNRIWDQPQVRTEIVVAQEAPRAIELNIAPLVDSKKRSIGRMLVFHDISSQKQNEVALKDTNKKLNEQIEEISSLQDELREQATRDPLTNLYNRRYLEEMLSQELARASRENYPICVIMIDIDRFKRVNDTCGHKAGDVVLQNLSTVIVMHIRRFDAACRFGGEEFVIVMPKLPLETARERAEFLRREFADITLPCAGLKTVPTLSIGLASYPIDGKDSEHLLNAADQALYAAKGAGRNRVVVHSDMAEKGDSSDRHTSK